MASAEVHHHPSLASNSSLKHSFFLSLFSHSLFLLLPFCCSLSLLYIYIPSLIFFILLPFSLFYSFSHPHVTSLSILHIFTLSALFPHSFSHSVIISFFIFPFFLLIWREPWRTTHHWLPCPQLGHLNFLSQTSRLHYKLALLYWGLFLYISFVVRKANFSPKNQAEMRK